MAEEPQYDLLCPIDRDSYRTWYELYHRGSGSRRTNGVNIASSEPEVIGVNSPIEALIRAQRSEAKATLVRKGFEYIRDIGPTERSRHGLRRSIHLTLADMQVGNPVQDTAIHSDSDGEIHGFAFNAAGEHVASGGQDGTGIDTDLPHTLRIYFSHSKIYNPERWTSFIQVEVVYPDDSSPAQEDNKQEGTENFIVVFNAAPLITGDFASYIDYWTNSLVSRSWWWDINGKFYHRSSDVHGGGIVCALGPAGEEIAIPAPIDPEPNPNVDYGPPPAKRSVQFDILPPNLVYEVNAWQALTGRTGRHVPTSISYTGDLTGYDQMIGLQRQYNPEPQVGADWEKAIWAVVGRAVEYDIWFAERAIQAYGVVNEYGSYSTQYTAAVTTIPLSFGTQLVGMGLANVDLPGDDFTSKVINFTGERIIDASEWTRTWDGQRTIAMAYFNAGTLFVGGGAAGSSKALRAYRWARQAKTPIGVTAAGGGAVATNEQWRENIRAWLGERTMGDVRDETSKMLENDIDVDMAQRIAEHTGGEVDIFLEELDQKLAGAGLQPSEWLTEREKVIYSGLLSRGGDCGCK